MVSRLLVIPASVAGVLFPAFAVTQGQDLNRTGLLLSRGVKYVFLAIFPMILVIVTLAPEILRLWLGAAFALNGSSVLRLLAVGILINCSAVIPFALLQGIGRPDITGKLLLVELPFYLAWAWMLMIRLGIEGAAIAWTSRVTMEALILLALGQRFLPAKVLSLKRLGVIMTLAVSVLFLATLPSGLAYKCAFLACALLAFVFVGWFLVLEPDERLFLARQRPPLGVTDSSIAGSATDRSGVV